jgi:hypothetical protein
VSGLRRGRARAGHAAAPAAGGASLDQARCEALVRFLDGLGQLNLGEGEALVTARVRLPQAQPSAATVSPPPSKCLPGSVRLRSLASVSFMVGVSFAAWGYIWGYILQKVKRHPAFMRVPGLSLGAAPPQIRPVASTSYWPFC